MVRQGSAEKYANALMEVCGETGERNLRNGRLYCSVLGACLVCIRGDVDEFLRQPDVVSALTGQWHKR